jgi:hypothetical protein
MCGLALVLGATACGNHALNQTPTGADAADAPKGSQADVGPEAGAATDAGPDELPPHPTPACGASCATPAGLVVPLANLTQASAAVTGRWLFCSGQDAWAAVGAPADAVGVEYGGGTMTYLVAGPNGPVRGTTQAHRLTYELIASGGGVTQMNMYNAAKAGFFAAIRYSPCPREVELFVGYSSNPSVLVPADGSGQAPPGAPVAPPEEPPAPPVDPSCALECNPDIFPTTEVTTLAEAATLLRGRWSFCLESELWRTRGAPDDVVAIEFGAARARPERRDYAGNAYYLVSGPGGPARGRGLEYQLEYSIMLDGPRFHFGLTSRRGGGQGRIDIAACPATIGLWGDLRGTLLRF